MNDEPVRIGEAARLAKVSVRTLRHYDEIGLLSPSHRSPGDYRLYSRRDLKRLFQIRLYREFAMPLEEIRRLLDDPNFDQGAALRQHRERLVERAREARALMEAVDRMLEGDAMIDDEMFEGFQKEAEERWGDTDAWKISQRRVAGYDKTQMRVIRAEHDTILADFAACMMRGDAASSEAARDLAERARLHVDRWFYPLDRAGHARLAELYVTDPRFQKTYDDAASGLAHFVRDAIAANR